MSSQNSWKWSWMMVCAVAVLATFGMAEQPGRTPNAPSMRGSNGFVSTLERRVGLTPEQRDAVRGLLADQRQKTQALREQTDQKIRAMLNPEQQKKFDEVLAEQKARRTRKKEGV